MSAISFDQATSLLFQEALLLDCGRFSEWLDLYTPDCVFWMPAWRDEGGQTEDPDRELSLIYYRGRRNLEDRIARIQSGHSVASAVRLRVSHLVGNVLPIETEEGVSVTSSFTVHLNDVRANRSHVFFGRYEHDLVAMDGGWRIQRKVIRLMNDVIPTLLDVYTI